MFSGLISKVFVKRDFGTGRVETIRLKNDKMHQFRTSIKTKQTQGRGGVPVMYLNQERTRPTHLEKLIPLGGSDF